MLLDNRTAALKGVSSSRVDRAPPTDLLALMLACDDGWLLSACPPLSPLTTPILAAASPPNPLSLPLALRHTPSSSSITPPTLFVLQSLPLDPPGLSLPSLLPPTRARPSKPTPSHLILRSLSLPLPRGPSPSPASPPLCLPAHREERVLAPAAVRPAVAVTAVPWASATASPLTTARPLSSMLRLPFPFLTEP